jgi:prevent-host-death family protein
MEARDMGKVTSAEFQKEFGRFRTIAQREPVVITNHGREDLVVLSIGEYSRLKRRDREVFSASALSAADLEALSNVRIPGEAYDFDSEVEG